MGRGQQDQEIPGANVTSTEPMEGFSTTTANHNTTQQMRGLRDDISDEDMMAAMNSIGTYARPFVIVSERKTLNRIHPVLKKHFSPVEKKVILMNLHLKCAKFSLRCGGEILFYFQQATALGKRPNAANLSPQRAL